MGKRQRARDRAAGGPVFDSPLLNEFAARMKTALQEGTPAQTLEALRRQNEAAAELAAKVAEATPPTPEPTPPEMLARSVMDAMRCEWQLGQEVWDKQNGKAARIIDVKFDKIGNPTYRLQRPDGRRHRFPANKMHSRWSRKRVHFPVDLTTGRFILPGKVAA